MIDCLFSKLKNNNDYSLRNLLDLAWIINFFQKIQLIFLENWVSF